MTSNLKSSVNPLDWRVPIVNSNGTPTAEFQRKWAQQAATNGKIPELTTPAQVSAVLDVVAGAAGDVLVRGATQWAGRHTPSDITKFLNGAATPAYAQVKDTDLSVTDVIGNNVSTAAHGFAPKLPNDATKFLDGTGVYSTPAGGGGGGGLPITNSPTSTTFTTTLGSPASKTDISGVGILLDAGAWGSGDRLAGYGIALPTPPYTLDVGLRFFGVPNSFGLGGLYISDGTKVMTFSRGQQLTANTAPSLKVDEWTNTTSFSSEIYGNLSDYPEILRLVDDGTNLNFYASRDGYAYTPIFAVGRTSFLTPSSIGFFVSANAGSAPIPAGDAEALLTYWHH